MKNSHILAALIAPLIPPALWIIMFLFSPNPDYDKNGSVWGSIMVFSLVIVSWYIVCVVGGTILYKILQRKHKLTLPWVVGFFTLIGAGLFSLFTLMLDDMATWKDAVFILSVGAIFGFITSSIFCVLAGISVRLKADGIRSDG